jgi:hypothetical protein
MFSNVPLCVVVLWKEKVRHLVLHYYATGNEGIQRKEATVMNRFLIYAVIGSLFNKLLILK